MLDIIKIVLINAQKEHLFHLINVMIVMRNVKNAMGLKKVNVKVVQTDIFYTIQLVLVNAQKDI